MSTAPVAATSAFREFRRGFSVIVTTLIGCAVGMVGLSVYSLPFLAGALSKDFTWQRPDITLASSFFVIGLAISGPIVGRLCDRAGVRTIVLVSIITYALGLIALSCFHGALWQFYLYYFLLAVAGAGTTYAAYARVVNTWFDGSRGLALGIMMSGPGLMASVLPLFLPSIVLTSGWRGGYVTLACLALVAWPLCFLFLRERENPGRVRREMDIGGSEPGGMRLREAMRTRQFWAILAGVALVTSAIGGTQVNMVDLLGRKHAQPTLITAASSFFGLFSIAGRLMVGLTLDRVRGPMVGGILFMFTALSMLLFNVANGWSFTLAAAACLGLSGGAEGDLCAYLVSRYFGLKAFSEIYGWVYSALALGLAGGAALARHFVAETGSYGPFLTVSAVGCAIAAVLYATLGSYHIDLSTGASETAS